MKELAKAKQYLQAGRRDEAIQSLISGIVEMGIEDCTVKEIDSFIEASGMKIESDLKKEEKIEAVLANL